MRNEIIELIKENLIEIIPELRDTVLSLDESLVNLGADSVDRGELITLTLERLNLNVSRIEFAGAKSICELADIIVKKQEKG